MRRLPLGLVGYALWGAARVIWSSLSLLVKR